jgi:urocanate hydratase
VQRAQTNLRYCSVLGNAAEMLPDLLRREVRPDAVTDQTSAHDPINGYLPAGWTVADWQARRESDPKGVETAAKESMAVHVRAMLEFWRRGVPISQHAGMVVVSDGTPEAARRIERVLWNDPASGVMRHADAGYDEAIACAKTHGLNLPSLG